MVNTDVVTGRAPVQRRKPSAFQTSWAAKCRADEKHAAEIAAWNAARKRDREDHEAIIANPRLTAAQRELLCKVSVEIARSIVAAFITEAPPKWWHNRVRVEQAIDMAASLTKAEANFLKVVLRHADNETLTCTGMVRNGFADEAKVHPDNVKKLTKNLKTKGWLLVTYPTSEELRANASATNRYTVQVPVGDQFEPLYTAGGHRLPRSGVDPRYGYGGSGMDLN